MHPARPVQLGQARADPGEEDRSGPGHGVAAEQGRQRVLGPLQHQHDGAVEFGAGGIVHGQGLVEADEPRAVEPAQQLHLAVDEFAQMGQPAGRVGAGGQELEGGRAGQAPAAVATGVRGGAGRGSGGGGAIVVVGAPQGRVDAAERAGGERFPYLPPADPVAPGDPDGVRLGHRTAVPADAGAAGPRLCRSSSRTRSKRSARETRDSFLPLRRGPGAAASGPGLRRSFTAR